MATIPGVMEVLGQGVVRVTWAELAGGDDGEPVRLSAFSDRTVQAVGDATSVTMLGSNDGTNGSALNDPDGDPIDLAGATFDLAMIRENPLFIWPVVTGGTDTTVIVIGQTER